MRAIDRRLAALEAAADRMLGATEFDALDYLTLEELEALEASYDTGETEALWRELRPRIIGRALVAAASDE
jgi:hypothetical protein